MAPSSPPFVQCMTHHRHAVRCFLTSLVLVALLSAVVGAHARTFYVLDIHPNSDALLIDEQTPSVAHREGFLAAIHALKDNTGTLDLAPRIELVTVDDPERQLTMRETVEAAVEQWPDLIAIFGPFNVDAVLELTNSGVLEEYNLVCLGLGSNSQLLRVWSPHFYFLRADPVTEVMSMIKYAINTITARRLGFMYIANTNLGEAEFDSLLGELQRTPIAAEDVALYAAEDVNAAPNETVLEAFLDSRPQVVMVYGRPGPHTSDFITRVLTDSRTQGAKLLITSTVAATAFEAIKALTNADTDRLGGAVDTDKNRSPETLASHRQLTSVLEDEQMLFTTTNHLGTEVQYAHIRYFQAQVRQFILDGQSSVYTAEDPDAFVTDVTRREMMVAGWVAGSTVIHVLRDPSWWNENVAGGYLVPGATQRERFMSYLFAPSRSYMVGEDFFLRTYGGECNVELGRTPEMGVACECNQGGRSGFVSKLIPSNMTLQSLPEYTFTYSGAYCYVKDVYKLPRPLGVLVLAATDVFNSTTTTKTIAADAHDPFETFSEDIEKSAMRAAAFINGVDTANTVSIKAIRTTLAEERESATSAFQDHLLTTCIGTMQPGAAIPSALLLNPFFSSVYTTDSSTHETIFILPTFAQQLYLGYEYLGLLHKEASKTKLHFVFRGMAVDEISAVQAVAKKTATHFKLPDQVYTSVSPSDDLLTALKAQDVNRKLVLGMQEGDVAILAAFLQDNQDASLLVIFNDLLLWYDAFITVFGKMRASVRRRVLFSTNLPLWTATSEAAYTASPLLQVYHASLPEGEAPTPLGLSLWAMTVFQSEVSRQITGVITADSLIETIYNIQSFGAYGLNFQNFRRCDDASDRARTAPVSSVSESRNTGSSGEESSDSDGYTGQDDVITGYEGCEARNYGAAQLSFYTLADVFSPNTATALYGPVTPSMVYTEKSGLSKGAIVGIAVGVSIALIALIVIIVLCCCCCRGSARDNKNAVRDLHTPVTLVFTDIESSTALWASDPEDMPDAVATHHKLIRSLIAKYKCYEVKTIGDSFMIACKDPFAAVQLASDIQTTFLKQDWGTNLIDECYHSFELSKEHASEEEIKHAHLHAANIDEDAVAKNPYVSPSAHLPDDIYETLWHGLRVRVGIHTGLSDIRYDEVTKGFDYYGETSNMAARTEAVGNGGQIILTESTWWALSTAERESLQCTMLGCQCLRGVPFAVEMIQVDAVPGRAFAPLRVEIEANLPPGADELEEEEMDSTTMDNTTRRARASCGSDNAIPDVMLTSQPKLQGPAKVMAMLLRIVFRPFRGEDKIAGITPLLQKWGVAIPKHQKNVPAEAYATALMSRLAVKLGLVTAASNRLREDQVLSEMGPDWESLGRSSFDAIGAWAAGTATESMLDSAVPRERLRHSSHAASASVLDASQPPPNESGRNAQHQMSAAGGANRWAGLNKAASACPRNARDVGSPVSLVLPAGGTPDTKLGDAEDKDGDAHGERVMKQRCRPARAVASPRGASRDSEGEFATEDALRLKSQELTAVAVARVGASRGTRTVGSPIMNRRNTNTNNALELTVGGSGSGHGEKGDTRAGSSTWVELESSTPLFHEFPTPSTALGTRGVSSRAKVARPASSLTGRQQSFMAVIDGDDKRDAADGHRLRDGSFGAELGTLTAPTGTTNTAATSVSRMSTSSDTHNAFGSPLHFSAADAEHSTAPSQSALTNDLEGVVAHATRAGTVPANQSRTHLDTASADPVFTRKNSSSTDGCLSAGSSDGRRIIGNPLAPDYM